MSKKQNGRLEKHIYFEERSGSLRFKVVVPPFQDSATFSTMDEGARWARRRRVELLESKASNKELALPELVHVGSTYSGFPYVPKALPSIRLSDVFDSYQRTDLPKLAGKDAEASRLVRLRNWFGERPLCQNGVRPWSDATHIIEGNSLAHESALGAYSYQVRSSRDVRVHKGLTTVFFDASSGR